MPRPLETVHFACCQETAVELNYAFPSLDFDELYTESKEKLRKLINYKWDDREKRIATKDY